MPAQYNEIAGDADSKESFVRQELRYGG